MQHPLPAVPSTAVSTQSTRKAGFFDVFLYCCYFIFLLFCAEALQPVEIFQLKVQSLDQIIFPRFIQMTSSQTKLVWTKVPVLQSSHFRHGTTWAPDDIGPLASAAA